MRITFITLLITLGITCAGQSLVDTSYSWNNSIIFEYPYGVVATETIKFSADTLINIVPYRKVQRSTDEHLSVWHPYGLIREDPDGRVYYRLSANDPELLLYDFTLHPGDTVSASGLFTFNQTVYTDSVTYHVSAVDSILVGGLYSKQLHLSIDQGCKKLVEVEHWIEGMGSTSGILHNNNLLVGRDSYSLLCFKDGDTLKYQNPASTSCYVSTGIAGPELLPDLVTVFPNPAFDKVSFSIRRGNKDPDISFGLFNPMGVAVLLGIYDGNFQVRIADLPAGLYFYEVTSGSKILGKGKLFKQ